MKQNSPVWLARWSDLGICRVADAVFQASRPPKVAELRSLASMRGRDGLIRSSGIGKVVHS